jgi:hypothetical protein
MSTSCCQQIIDNTMVICESLGMSQDPERRRAQAREVLLAAGGAGLGSAPWQHPKEAPADGVLLRFALWRVTGQGDDVSVPELEAGLSLIDSARSELDSLETALVFTARAEGLTWARIAEALGLRSPQAAQQRYQRTAERPRPAAEHTPARAPHA